MLLIDLSHTSHTRAQTGIQRVCRSLHAALSAVTEVEAITHDPFAHAWRTLNAEERTNLLSDGSPVGSRGARWPWTTRWSGRLARWSGRARARLPAADALVVPEIFSPSTAAALPALFSAVRGPRIALFHDAIALKFPELTPAKTVARFPAYLIELLRFDGIAAVSENSRQELLDYWRWLGVAHTPPVRTFTLGLAPIPATAPKPPAGSVPIVLSVGSLEGRKNHLSLLEACEAAWSRGLRFELELIGLAHPQTGRAALSRLRALQAAGRPLRYHGPVDDPALHAAYARCAFTVYPSLIEGFGLPVLESLAHGKPCICSAHGALGESARDGGCVPLEHVTAPALDAAITRLLTDATLLATLTAETRARTFKSWDSYARELLDWTKLLRPKQ